VYSSWLVIDNSLSNPTYTSTIEKILDNHQPIFHFLGISAKDEELCHSTGYLDLTSVLTNGLCYGACQMLHESSFQIMYIYQQQKPGFSVTVALITLEVVWIRFGFWKKSTHMLSYIQSHSSHAIYLNQQKYSFVNKTFWF